MAKPAEIASADRLLREGLRYMPPDSDVAEWAERLRPAGYAGLLQGLLGAFAGDAGGAGRGVAHGEDASVRSPGSGRSPGSVRTPGQPANPDPATAPMSASVPDAEPEDIPLSAAAVLPGDGSGYPFTEPVGRIIEIVTQPARPGSHDDGHRPAAVIAVHALALHRRWLHESGTSDLTDAIALTQQAIATLDGSDGPLADRLAMLLAGMLLDRHLLLGDRMDLAAAREVYGGRASVRTPATPTPNSSLCWPGPPPGPPWDSLISAPCCGRGGRRRPAPSPPNCSRPPGWSVCSPARRRKHGSGGTPGRRRTGQCGHWRKQPPRCPPTTLCCPR